MEEELWELCNGAGSEVEWIIRRSVQDIANVLVGEGVVKGVSPEELMTKLYHTKINDHPVSQDNNYKPYVDFQSVESDEYINAGTA